MSINEANIIDVEDANILENTPMMVVEQDGKIIAVPIMGGGGVQLPTGIDVTPADVKEGVTYIDSDGIKQEGVMDNHGKVEIVLTPEGTTLDAGFYESINIPPYNQGVILPEGIDVTSADVLEGVYYIDAYGTKRVGRMTDHGKIELNVEDLTSKARYLPSGYYKGVSIPQFSLNNNIYECTTSDGDTWQGRRLSFTPEWSGNLEAFTFSEDSYLFNFVPQSLAGGVYKSITPGQSGQNRIFRFSRENTGDVDYIAVYIDCTLSDGRRYDFSNFLYKISDEVYRTDTTLAGGMHYTGYADLKKVNNRWEFTMQVNSGSFYGDHYEYSTYLTLYAPPDADPLTFDWTQAESGDDSLAIHLWIFDHYVEPDTRYGELFFNATDGYWTLKFRTLNTDRGFYPGYPGSSLFQSKGTNGNSTMAEICTDFPGNLLIDNTQATTIGAHWTKSDDVESLEVKGHTPEVGKVYTADTSAELSLFTSSDTI